MDDKINPSHYKDTCSIECIEAIEMALGADGVFAFCLGNAIKYLWRHSHKNGYEDIRKADWYVERAEATYERLARPIILDDQLFAIRNLVEQYKETYEDRQRQEEPITGRVTE